MVKFSAILGFLSCIYHYVHQIYLSVYRSIYQSITYTPINNPEDIYIYYIYPSNIYVSIHLAIYLYGVCVSEELFIRVRSSRPEVFLRICVLKLCSKFIGEQPCPIVICAKQLYWNRTSASVLFCKFAAYFQKAFS